MSPRRVAPGSVEVRGLPELQRALRKMDRTFPRELSKLNRNAADEVLREAESEGMKLGGVHAKTVRVGAMKARGEQRGAKVVIDASRPTNRFALGAEFGSIEFHQFPPWRGNQWTGGFGPGGGVGYMLHPAIRNTEFERIRLYDRGIEELFDRLSRVV